jgi:hypothetical protein
MSARGHPAALSKKGQAMWPEAGERRLQTLPEQIAERIYAAIVAGEFAPSVKQSAQQWSAFATRR